MQAYLCENKILEITNKHVKYRKFNKFIKCDITSPNRLNRLIQPKGRVRRKCL